MSASVWKAWRIVHVAQPALRTMFICLTSTAAIAVPPDPPGAESPPIAKVRYISFVPGNAGRTIALRVTLSYFDTPPVPTGKVRWVGPPGQYVDGTGTFTASTLQCTPHYQDWGAIALLHVTGGHNSDGEIRPNSIFAVQGIEQGADINNEAEYSSSLIAFTSAWTDTVGRWDKVEWTPPDGVVSYYDVLAGLDHFVGRPLAIGRVRVATRVTNPGSQQGFSSLDVQPSAFAGLPFGFGSQTPSCPSAAVFACGNGVPEPGEACDDGAAISGDGCSALCLIEPDCGNGRIDSGEGCDDGSAAAGDGCSGACTLEAVCGNGRVELDEECDDGNTTAGDGCDATCLAEQRSAILSLIPVAATGSHVFSGGQLMLSGSGNRIWLEARLSDWDPGTTGSPTVRAYQFVLDAASMGGGLSGGFEVPRVMCAGGNPDVACTAEFGHGSRCTGLPLNFCQPSFIEDDEERSDGLFYQEPNIWSADSRTLGMRLGAVLIIGNGVPDGGGVSYLATFVLDVPGEASGVYSIGFESGFNRTFVTDNNNMPIPLASIEPAMIHVAEQNRYLAYALSSSSVAAAEPLAVRVKIVSLPLFPTFEGQIRWAAPPASYPDTVSGSFFDAAALQCTAEVQDWTGVDVVQLYGAEVVPGSSYEIRTATAACLALGEESCMSPPVLVPTAMKWADIVVPVGGNGQPAFLDISAAVAAFQGAPGAVAKSRAQLQPRLPNPSNNVNFLDISAMVGSFQGDGYPFTGPTNCAE